MTRSTWLAIAATLYAIFGLGLLLVPAAFMSQYGVSLDGGGQMMARILGAALTSLALMFWLYRGATREVLISVLITGLLYNLVDIVVVLNAVLAGTMNAFGWFPVALHVMLAAGFAYCIVDRREVRAPA
ncbi:MAG: hypothetical protein AB7I79_03470 [Rhizobiaceae bacterium]